MWESDRSDQPDIPHVRCARWQAKQALLAFFLLGRSGSFALELLLDPFWRAPSSLPSGCSAISPSSCSPPLSSGEAVRERSSSASEEVMALYLKPERSLECATQHLARAIGSDTQMSISFPGWDKRSAVPQRVCCRNATLVLGRGQTRYSFGSVLTAQAMEVQPSWRVSHHLRNGVEWVGRSSKAKSSQTSGVMRGARGKRFDHATDDWQVLDVWCVTRLGATADRVSKWAVGKQLVSAGIGGLGIWALMDLDS